MSHTTRLRTSRSDFAEDGDDTMHGYDRTYQPSTTPRASQLDAGPARGRLVRQPSAGAPKRQQTEADPEAGRTNGGGRGRQMAGYAPTPPKTDRHWALSGADDDDESGDAEAPQQRVAGAFNFTKSHGRGVVGSRAGVLGFSYDNPKARGSKDDPRAQASWMDAKRGTIGRAELSMTPRPDGHHDAKLRVAEDTPEGLKGQEYDLDDVESEFGEVEQGLMKSMSKFAGGVGPRAALIKLYSHVKAAQMPKDELVPFLAKNDRELALAIDDDLDGGVVTNPSCALRVNDDGTFETARSNPSCQAIPMERLARGVDSYMESWAALTPLQQMFLPAGVIAGANTRHHAVSSISEFRVWFVSGKLEPCSALLQSGLELFEKPHYIVVVDPTTPLPGYPGKTCAAILQGVPFITGRRVTDRERTEKTKSFPAVSMKRDRKARELKEILVNVDASPQYHMTQEGREAIIALAFDIGFQEQMRHGNVHANMLAGTAEIARRREMRAQEADSIGVGRLKLSHDLHSNARHFG